VLGPSFASPGGGGSAGPLGPLSPHPGVSYLFDRGASAWASDDAPAGGPGGPDHSLWAIAHAGAPPSVPLGGGAASWTPALAEVVVKIDQKLKVRVHAGGRARGADAESRSSSRSS
jgi:hypothetical protein